MTMHPMTFTLGWVIAAFFLSDAAHASPQAIDALIPIGVSETTTAFTVPKGQFLIGVHKPGDGSYGSPLRIGFGLASRLEVAVVTGIAWTGILHPAYPVTSDFEGEAKFQVIDTDSLKVAIQGSYGVVYQAGATMSGPAWAARIPIAVRIPVIDTVVHVVPGYMESKAESFSPKFAGTIGVEKQLCPGLRLYLGDSLEIPTGERRLHATESKAYHRIGGGLRYSPADHVTLDIGLLEARGWDKDLSPSWQFSRIGALVTF